MRVLVACLAVSLCVAGCSGASSSTTDGGGGGGLAWAYTFPTATGPTVVAISADGSRILVGCHEEYALLRSNGTAVWEAAEVTSSYSTITNVALSSDGAHGGVGFNDMVVAVSSTGKSWATNWDANEFQLSGGGYAGAIGAVAISDGGTIAVASDYPMKVTGRSSAAWINENYSGVGGGDVGISGSGSLVALDCQYSPTRLVVLNGSSGAYVGAYPTGDLIDDVDVSWNGSTVVAGGYGGVQAIGPDASFLWSWAASSYSASHISSVGTSADGSRVVAGGSDGHVRLFSRSGTLLWNYNALPGSVQAVALSADGSTVGVAGGYGAVTLLSAATGTPVLSYRPTANIPPAVHSIALSADGRIAIVGSAGRAYLFRR